MKQWYHASSILVLVVLLHNYYSLYSMNVVQLVTDLLFEAIENQNPRMVTVILKSYKNVQINAVNAQGFTPLHVAVKSYEMCASNTDSHIDLVSRLKSNSIHILAALIGYPGIDIRATTKKGQTILHMAVGIGDIQFFTLLIKKLEPFIEEERILYNKNRSNRFINLRDCMGKTAIYSAAERGHYDITKLLLIYGADPKISDNSGSDATDAAYYAKHNKIVKLLLGDSDLKISRSLKLFYSLILAKL